MSKTRIRTVLRRYHIWLGWLVGVPLLFWTLSGVVMVWKPIDEVRGSALLAPAAPFTLSATPVVPDFGGRRLTALAIEPRAAGPRWVAQFAGGGSMLADPATGALLPNLTPADAVREFTARYRGTARIVSTQVIDSARPPLDLRRKGPAFAITMSDGAHFFVAADSGAVIATRTRFWRFYDWMWGLHIMDLGSRENTHNPWIVGFGLLTLLTTVLALVLLPLTGKRRRRP